MAIKQRSKWRSTLPECLIEVFGELPSQTSLQEYTGRRLPAIRTWRTGGTFSYLAADMVTTWLELLNEHSKKNGLGRVYTEHDIYQRVSE